MPSALGVVGLLAGTAISMLLKPSVPKPPSPAPIPKPPALAPAPVAHEAPKAEPTISPADSQGAAKDQEAQRKRLAAKAFQAPVLGVVDDGSLNVKKLLGE